MKVFISWSGKRSLALASALREWLPMVINATEPWLSSTDIASGSRWNLEVAKSLDESNVGIFCLTNENLDSTWLHFEAGAIAKNASKSFACTLLLDIAPTQVKWPLAQFQAKQADQTGIFELVKAINEAATIPLLSAAHLERSFKMWWPELQTAIRAIPAPETTQEPPRKRTQEDLLTEVLSLLRDQERNLSSTPRAFALPTRVHKVVRKSEIPTFSEKINTERIANNAKSILGQAGLQLRQLIYTLDGMVNVIWLSENGGKTGNATISLREKSDRLAFSSRLQKDVHQWLESH